MQFYIIHKDPEINSKYLPDYALKKVNIREGYQILSDCGHALGLSWETQNKEYNRYHPNTWRFWKTKSSFYDFIDYYTYNLMEYKARFGEDNFYTTYKIKFNIFIFHALPLISQLNCDMTEEEHTMLYLVSRKTSHITVEEISRLRELFLLSRASKQGEN